MVLELFNPFNRLYWSPFILFHIILHLRIPLIIKNDDEVPFYTVSLRSSFSVSNFYPRQTKSHWCCLSDLPNVWILLMVSRFVTTINFRIVPLYNCIYTVRFGSFILKQRCRDHFWNNCLSQIKTRVVKSPYTVLTSLRLFLVVFTIFPFFYFRLSFPIIDPNKSDFLVLPTSHWILDKFMCGPVTITRTTDRQGVPGLLSHSSHSFRLNMMSESKDKLYPFVKNFPLLLQNVSSWYTSLNYVNENKSHRFCRCVTRKWTRISVPRLGRYLKSIGENESLPYLLFSKSPISNIPTTVSPF